jgi:tRNA 2-thiouridine synthesizing protein B
MNTLHIFSKPLNNYSATTIELIQNGNNQVLLTGDACFDWRSFTSLQVKNIYLLKTCVELRNIETTDAVNLIDDSQWVELITTNNTVNW